MSEAHARLGPSNHRWPNCPGSVREEAQYPDVPGTAAIDGTGSHLLLEMCLQNNVRADAYDMQIIGANHHDSPNGWLVDKDRVDRVQMCLDYITRRVNELRTEYPGCKVKVESESKADPGGMSGRTDYWGTVDITITVTNKHERCLFLEVCDYKDGRGYVHTKDNTQLISYLAGKLRPFIASGPELVRPFRPERVGPCRMTIVQPKTDPVVRYEDVTAEYIVEKYLELERAATATDDPDAPLIPDGKNGKGYCRWCKHKPNCTANFGTAITSVKTMTNELGTTSEQPLFVQLENAVANIESIPDTNLANLADTEAAVQAIYKKITDEIQRRVDLGRSVPGYEMRPGNSTNKWNCSEEEVVKVLKSCRLKKDDMYPPSLISPAQARKLDLSDKYKEKIETCITNVAGKLKLTKVARVAKEKQSAELMFADVPREPTKSTHGLMNEATEVYKENFENNVEQSSDNVVASSSKEVSFF